MRVLYLHQYFTTPSGSGGIRSYHMAKRLLDEGHEVVIVCGSYSEGKTGLDGPFVKGVRRGYVDGIDVIEYKLGYSNHDRFLRRTFLFLKYAMASCMRTFTEDYDIVFATSTPLTVAIPGLTAKWIRRKRFVFEVRDLWPELPRAMGVIKNPFVLWGMSVLEWLGYRSADQCIALAPGIADGIRKRGVPESRIAIVPNGCDLSIFDRQKAVAWRPIEVSDSDFLAIFAGTHGQANGLDAVLDAAKSLQHRDRQDIKLLLVGDGKLKKDLLQRAESEKLTNVVFLDSMPKARLAGLMAGCDAGMQILANIPAFYYGTSPNKFFDYLAASLPVIITYPGWVTELVQQVNCGLAVPPDDADAFAQSLIDLADSPSDRQAMSVNALQLAKDQFDRQDLSRRWVVAVLGDQNMKEASC